MGLLICCVALGYHSLQSTGGGTEGAEASLGIGMQAEGEPQISLRDMLGKELANVYCIGPDSQHLSLYRTASLHCGCSSFLL